MTTSIYTWPASLPQKPLANGYNEGFQDTVIRSKVESGASKARQRYTRLRKLVDVAFQMNTAQKATFETFLSTIGGGAHAYNWPHPLTGTAQVVQMTGPVTGPKYLAPNIWQISFQLEIMP
ncbi:hypothetical protein [Flavobacterium sp.]|uniref:hypothetical protein n=1 Tax=Flavobacterium sp. TaxID=239 RepID=UPI0037C0C756